MATVELSEIKAGVSNFKLLSYILDEKRDLSPKAKLVAVALIRHRNSTTLACFPSYDRLKELTGYSKISIIRAIKELEEKQVIVVERNHQGPRGRAVNHYLFLYDALDAFHLSQDDRMNTDLAPEEESMLHALFI